MRQKRPTQADLEPAAAKGRRDRGLQRDAPPALHGPLTAQRIVALQRFAGNASVAAMLQREPAPPVPAPAPTPAPAVTPPPDLAKDAHDLLSAKLTTSKDYAGWLIDARDKGFVAFTEGMGSEAQMEQLKAGNKVGGVDPAGTTVIPALLTMYDVVKGPVTRWAAKPTDPKPVVKLGSFIRSNAGRHTTGAAIDINEESFTGKAEQLITILGDLSPGSYGLGIPFQGDYLPDEKDLAAKEAEEGAKPEPADLSDMLKLDYGWSYKATWDKDKKTWNEEKDKGDMARAWIKSDALKTKISDLAKAGVTFEIFADRKNHFHIDRR
jgi:hypothetical protein